MNNFYKTVTFYIGAISGYIYVLSFLIIEIIIYLSKNGILKTTGYWGIMEHPDTVVCYLFAVLLLGLCLFVVPNVFLYFLIEDIFGKCTPPGNINTNAFVTVLNVIAFCFFALCIPLILLAGMVTPPFIPEITAIVVIAKNKIKKPEQ